MRCSGRLNLDLSFEWVQDGTLSIFLMCWFALLHSASSVLLWELHSLPLHTPSIVNKPFCISGVSSICKFHFWFHLEWIPCDDSAYLKQSNKMNISLRFLLECFSVTARWIFVCGEKGGSGFQLNPWRGWKAALYISRHYDLLVWQLTKNCQAELKWITHHALFFGLVSQRAPAHTQLKSTLSSILWIASIVYGVKMLIVLLKRTSLVKPELVISPLKEFEADSTAV